MRGTADFPFDIEAVVNLTGITVRRTCSDGVYTDCPFCGDNRGKLKVNYEKNVWRCNYCGESGGMLQLYAKIRGCATTEAYRSICQDLQNGIVLSSHLLPSKEAKPKIPESGLAAPEVLHATYTALLGELILTKEHRNHLREVRGLTDADIDRLGFKSTPPFYRCRSITEHLMALGYTVAGVPGFYQKDGKWTVNFCSCTMGILLPAKDYEGNIVGFQIRLDTPLRNDNDTSDKPGAKYIWLSSSGKPSGCSSGSPTHLVGDCHAHTVYVTEGILKADVTHCLTGRTFAAIAGANNLTTLDKLFQKLSSGGTRQIIEAHDMDKYRNAMVDRGASEIGKLAQKYGMECKRLTWNPNYKGIDDWQLALRRKNTPKTTPAMCFKERFLHGLCTIDTLDDAIQAWNESAEHTTPLPVYMGLTEEEYTLYLCGKEKLKQHLRELQTVQSYRIYQLDFEDGEQTKAFAFAGMDALRKAGFTQPPAKEYRLVCEGTMQCGKEEPAGTRLQFLFHLYNDHLPADYKGRSISPSDVIELYSTEERRYYYRDTDSFCEVRFSPFLAKPMK